MIRFFRRHVTKFYTAFIVTCTLLITTDLLQLSTRTFILTATKTDQFSTELHFRLKYENRTEQIETTRAFVKTKDVRIYLFSAHIVYNEIQTTSGNANKTKQHTPTVVITGWEFQKHSNSNFKCCYILGNGTLESEVSSEKLHWLYLGKAKLQAKQYKCPITRAVLDIKMVSIVIENSSCPKEQRFFIRPSLNQTWKKEMENRANIGVCSKLSFGSLDPHRLVEWFEVHRIFGVDKVVSYRYKLNTKARRVYEYYEKIGIAEVYDFSLPEQGTIKRDVGIKNMQSWNDEQIVLYDCQERLRNYDYIAVVDTDEFIIPTTNRFENSWRTYLDRKFRKTNIAGIFFPVQVHADTWGATNPEHPLHIGRFNNCTLPMYDRIKGIHMTARVQKGTVSTHSMKPLSGFKRAFVKGKEATLHHFRGCRGEWLKQRKQNDPRPAYLYYRGNGTQCFDLRQTGSELVGRLSNFVKDRVVKIINEIGV